MQATHRQLFSMRSSFLSGSSRSQIASRSALSCWRCRRRAAPRGRWDRRPERAGAIQQAGRRRRVALAAKGGSSGGAGGTHGLGRRDRQRRRVERRRGRNRRNHRLDGRHRCRRRWRGKVARPEQAAPVARPARRQGSGWSGRPEGRRARAARARLGARQVRKREAAVVVGCGGLSGIQRNPGGHAADGLELVERVRLQHQRDEDQGGGRRPGLERHEGRRLSIRVCR